VDAGAARNAKDSDSGAGPPVVFWRCPLGQYLETIMDKQTCAACDYELDDTRIAVTVGGKTVEVCCEECAQKLREATASA
jgi:hypothetical protein